MAVSLISAVVLSIFMLYILKAKRLHMFETLLVWQASFFFYASIFLILSLNLKWIHYSDHYPNIVVNIMFIFIIVPLFTTWAIDFAYRRSFLYKAASIILFSLLLTGVHGLMKKYHFVSYAENWKIGYMFVIFLLICIAIEIFRIIMHSVMKSEVQP